MTEIDRRAALGALAGAGLAAATPAFAKGQKPWNLVFILADDHARWGVRTFGNPEVITPNLDRLAAQGAKLNSAFATTPICTPSRLSTYTGMETIQIGTLNDVIGHPAPPLPYGVPSWAREARKAGYRTGFIGKWHMGSEPERSPTRYGFDYFYGFRAGTTSPKDPLLCRGEGPHERVKGWTDNLLVDDAIAWLTTAKDKPFALALNLRGPHLPHVPEPDADMAAVKDIDPAVPEDIGVPGIVGMQIEGADAAQRKFIQDQRRDYYAAIHNVDFNVGRVMQALDDLKLTGHTIVLYASDNGYLLGERGLFNKGAASPIQYDNFLENRELWVINLLDLSIRIPMIARWPGVVKPGTEIDQLVAMVDIYPTILGMLGVPLPADAAPAGADFSRVLRGQTTGWRDTVFGQYTSDRIGNTEFLRMARTDRWKLVKFYLNPGADKLYDLAADPKELKNLYEAKEHRAVRDQLETRLVAWQQSLNDPALELQRAYDANQAAARKRWGG